MKVLRAPWKCRAVENQENQTPVSLRFPPPLEIAARFPHSHRADDDASSPKQKDPERRQKGTPASPPTFRPILGLENATRGPNV
jgi:hypothetical protein